MHQFTDGGLTNVWLVNGYEEVETPYGKAVSYHNLDGLIKAICEALTDKKTPLTGPEFRYLRQALCLSQASLGQLLEKTNQAIAKWEKSADPVPRTADITLRVLYKQHADGNEKIKNLVTALNVTEQTLSIVMKDTGKGWKQEEKEGLLQA